MEDQHRIIQYGKISISVKLVKGQRLTPWTNWLKEIEKFCVFVFTVYVKIILAIP